jgi:hypothetical protein
MKIKKWVDADDYWCQRDLPETLKTKDISAVLPGIEPKGRSADGKTDKTFTFLADGEPCAIWRWKRSSWSCYGPEEVFIKLGLLPANQAG